jgi:hypothetical protein
MVTICPQKTSGVSLHSQEVSLDSALKEDDCGDGECALNAIQLKGLKKEPNKNAHHWIGWIGWIGLRGTSIGPPPLFDGKSTSSGFSGRFSLKASH